MYKIMEAEASAQGNSMTEDAFSELEQGIHAALGTYSNVHRGSGHNSMVTTSLYEQARDIVLEHLKLRKGRYHVIFCTPWRAAKLRTLLKQGSYKTVSSEDTGLPLAVRALVVKKSALPGGAPFHTGGGTASLVSPSWIVWAGAPDKFEAGTPSIINVITFAKALRLIGRFGKDAFRELSGKKLTADDILYHDELEKYKGRELLEALRQSLIGRGAIVPTTKGPRPFINLDNGASTPTFTPVWNSVCQIWHQPEQVHQEVINEARKICAGFIGAPLSDYDVIFASNATEAINLAAESLKHESGRDIEPVVLNTLLEHTSNDLPWRMIPGLSLIRLKVDVEGFVDLNELDSLMDDYNRKGMHGKKRIRIFAVSGASNVLGVYNNLEEISNIVHRYGARLLVDAAQMIAHRSVDVERCGIDYLAFSGHKVYAPFGCGVLVAKKGHLHFNPADMELINKSGEENPGGIAALGKAMVLLQRIGMDIIREREHALTVKVLSGLGQIEGLRLFGIKDPDSPSFARKGGVIVFEMKGMFANKVAKELAERGGIGIRYGCHCAHLLVKYLLNVPPWLERFQRIIAILFRSVAFPGMARVSLGIENSEEDIDELIKVAAEIAKHPAERRQSNIKQQLNDFTRAAAHRVYGLTGAPSV